MSTHDLEYKPASCAQNWLMNSRTIGQDFPSIARPIFVFFFPLLCESIMKRTKRLGTWQTVFLDDENPLVFLFFLLLCSKGGCSSSRTFFFSEPSRRNWTARLAGNYLTLSNRTAWIGWHTGNIWLGCKWESIKPEFIVLCKWQGRCVPLIDRD